MIRREDERFVTRSLKQRKIENHRFFFRLILLQSLIRESLRLESLR